MIYKGRPSSIQVSSAIAGAIDRFASIRAVIAHGSWVRGDFWPGQSDLDLIVIGAAATTPEYVRPRIEALHRILGPRVESWETCEIDLERIRAERSGRQLIRECGVIQLDVNGFDVVDWHEVLWTENGGDPLNAFPVPRGRALQGVTARYLFMLRDDEIARYGASEMNRVACDAIKAATNIFLLKDGREPTRNKNELLSRFFEVVPLFAEMNVARLVWGMYRQGNKAGDSTHQEACRRFVYGLVELVKSHCPELLS